MFFLIRVAFWLSIVLVLLPSGGKEPSPPFGAVEAASAAGAAMSDFSQFCERQPAACVLGSQAASVFGQRVQAGAKTAIEFIGDRMQSDDDGKPTATGSARVKSTNTLTPADMEPSWRGPKSAKEPKRPA